MFALGLLAGCGGERAETTSPTSQQQAGSGIVYVHIDSRFRQLVKQFQIEPDPADSAHDKASCMRAGGDWATVYQLGMLSLREPLPNAVGTHKVCWSHRKPTELGDGGKACHGQSDCIGNCVAEANGAGGFGKPVCQRTSENLLCGYIYDHGRYHQETCPAMTGLR